MGVAGAAAIAIDMASDSHVRFPSTFFRQGCQMEIEFKSVRKRIS